MAHSFDNEVLSKIDLVLVLKTNPKIGQNRGILVLVLTKTTLQVEVHTRICHPQVEFNNCYPHTIISQYYTIDLFECENTTSWLYLRHRACVQLINEDTPQKYLTRWKTASGLKMHYTF